ncbi:MAG TPA: hypothetical protein VKV17_07110 [Bryobacteraceae bacterium]|nr:hypothetical protein [Bryobacteraceae bacterium]
MKRFIFWDFARATWQYDLMVGFILSFIFLTPRAWFHDWPRTANASSIAILPTDKGDSVFFVNSALLAGVAEGQRLGKLTGILQARTNNRHLTVIRVEPVLDSEGELEGYMAFARS